MSLKKLQNPKSNPLAKSNWKFFVLPLSNWTILRLKSGVFAGENIAFSGYCSLIMQNGFSMTPFELQTRQRGEARQIYSTLQRSRNEVKSLIKHKAITNLSTTQTIGNSH